MKRRQADKILGSRRRRRIGTELAALAMLPRCLRFIVFKRDRKRRRRLLQLINFGTTSFASMDKTFSKVAAAGRAASLALRGVADAAERLEKKFS